MIAFVSNANHSDPKPDLRNRYPAVENYFIPIEVNNYESQTRNLKYVNDSFDALTIFKKNTVKNHHVKIVVPEILRETRY